MRAVVAGKGSDEVDDEEGEGDEDLQGTADDEKLTGEDKPESGVGHGVLPGITISSGGWC